MNRRSFNIVTILFITSTIPIIIITYLFPSHFQNNSTILSGQVASSILLNLHEKDYVPSPPVTANKGDGKVVYLTFDDGPNLYTQEILNILNSRGVQATFFLLKNNIEKHPTLVNTLIESGHSVGCHGVSHRVDIFYSTVDSPIAEMKACQQTIYQVTRRVSPLIRVPFGSFPYLTPAMEEQLEQEGFIYWDWNIDSDDWRSSNEKVILTNINKQLQIIEENGQTPTILLHDKQVTVNLLPTLLDHLLARGYVMTGISNNTTPIQFNRLIQPALE